MPGGASLAVTLVLVALPAPGRAARLTRLEAAAVTNGAVVRLHLSGSTSATVHEAPGTPTRLYLDLPAGTRLAPRAAGSVRVVPPLARLRVGVAEDGAPRIVVDLADAATHRLRRGGRTVTLELTPLPGPPEPAPVADDEVDRAPEPAATVRAEMARQPSGRHPLLSGLRPKIVLDPGHGGRDPGARGFAVEKDVTLGIARRLATLLRQRLKADVILTRTGDATLPLPARTARANVEGADLFVSIHANASRRREASGVETYYLNNTNDHATNRLAAMENGLDLLGPPRGRPDLRYILSDLVQVGKMEESIALASELQRELVGHLREEYTGVTDLGVKQGPFYVLVGAYMPCVLVEAAFLTHPAEGRRLAGPGYQQAVAEGLYRGVSRFLAGSRRAQTL